MPRQCQTIRPIIIAVIAWVISSVSTSSAESLQPQNIAESVKAARIKSLDLRKLNHIRAVSKSILDTQRQRVRDDKRNALVSDLNALRDELQSQRRVHMEQGVTPLASGSSNIAHGNDMRAQRSASLNRWVTRLRDRRNTLTPGNMDKYQLDAAIGKTRELEAKLTEILSLPVEEQGMKMDEMISRLTVHRLSEITDKVQLQPTLIIRQQGNGEDNTGRRVQ